MSQLIMETDFQEESDNFWDKKLISFLNKVSSQPYKYDYFSLLRQLESIKFISNEKILGKATHPQQERIRVKQEPSLIFSPRNIQSVTLSPRYIEISINGFGLFGPSGPLPLYITEYAYERKHQYGDNTWVGFINIFQHRLAILFYRAWANAQSINSLDKNKRDYFGRYISCFNGLDSSIAENTGFVHEFSKRYFAGLLLKQSRSAANLQQLLNRYFKVPVAIETNIGRWVNVEGEKTKIGSTIKYKLGEGLLLGDKLYDVQSKFRIIIGPITLDGYKSFFKNGFNTQRIKEWIYLFVAEEYELEIQPILMQQEVPKLNLGNTNQLGLSMWLGNVSQDAKDLIVSF